MSARRLVRVALSSLILAHAAPALASDEAVPDPAGAVSAAQWAAGCEAWDEWDKPAPPFRIHGSTWYVGTCGIAAILIATDDGHVLIDTGTEAGAQVVLDNIARLGLRTEDIVALLHSHEHFDHVGGHARVAAASGAEVIVSAPAQDVLGTGKDNPADPQFGLHPAMKPVSTGRVVSDGETLRFGDLEITAIATPGHTPGALSWHWESCEPADGCQTVVYADSLSPVSADRYRFADHPAYVAGYREGLQRLRDLPCDILLTPHPSASKMVERAARGSLSDRAGACEAYADAIATRLHARLTNEGRQ